MSGVSQMLYNCSYLFLFQKIRKTKKVNSFIHISLDFQLNIDFIQIHIHDNRIFYLIRGKLYDFFHIDKNRNKINDEFCSIKNLKTFNI